jgi:hypothetical protein
VSGPLEHHQLSTGNGSGHLLADLKEHNGIVASVNHNGRNGDIGQRNAALPLVGALKQPSRCLRFRSASTHHGLINEYGIPSGFLIGSFFD